LKLEKQNEGRASSVEGRVRERGKIERVSAEMRDVPLPRKGDLKGHPVQDAAGHRAAAEDVAEGVRDDDGASNVRSR